MKNSGNGRQRARARVAHLYLEEGLVDEAKEELEVLISELADGAETIAAESNGGGRREKPATVQRGRRGKGRTAKAIPEPEGPPRRSPELEAAAMAERRREALAGDLPAPVSDDRSARAFTPEERFQVAEYAREHTITKACETFNLSWPCVRDWIEKYPAGSKVPTPA
jgi:hypothetical protein